MLRTSHYSFSFITTPVPFNVFLFSLSISVFRLSPSSYNSLSFNYVSNNSFSFCQSFSLSPSSDFPCSSYLHLNFQSPSLFAFVFPHSFVYTFANGQRCFDLRLREAGLSPLPNNNCNGRKPDSRTPFTQTFIITFNLDRSLCLCFNSHFCVFTLCSMFVCLAEQAILEALMWKTFNFQTTKHSLRHKLKTFKARRQERQSKTLSTYSFSVPSTTNHTLEMFLKWDIVCILFVYFPIFSNNLQN